MTRFGPEGFSKRPLYASEKDDTTYYEFSYWKLKDWESEYRMLTKAYLLKFDFNPQSKPIDIQKESDKDQILSRSTYKYSHKWIHRLKNIPESITYPSVRDPNPGGINFAIYDGKTVSNVVLVQEVTMMILNSDTVEVTFDNHTQTSISP